VWNRPDILKNELRGVAVIAVRVALDVEADYLPTFS